MSALKLALADPIAFVEDGDEIVADLNKNELNCTALTDPAVLKARKAAWEKVVAANGGLHPNCGVADTRLLHRARLQRRSGHPRWRLASESRGLGAPAARSNPVRLRAEEQAPAGGGKGLLAVDGAAPSGL